MKTKELQRLLKAKGFNPGKIDGIDGPKTQAALVEFKRSIGFRARPFLGPLTIAALRDGVVAAPAEFMINKSYDVKMPPWLRFAYSFLGLREIVGPRHNDAIIGWWEALKLPFRDDETPWCAGFMNRMIQMSGLVIPKKYRAAALGWKWNGYGTKLTGPALGAVMMMERQGRPGSGHTTFVAGRSSSGQIMGLGGNQGNKVGINPYHPKARKAVYYWPEGYPLPDDVGLHTLPVISSSGKQLSNEA